MYMNILLGKEKTEYRPVHWPWHVTFARMGCMKMESQATKPVGCWLCREESTGDGEFSLVSLPFFDIHDLIQFPPHSCLVPYEMP